MHERDLEQRPEWSQKVVDAIVRAQLWIRDNRAETAQLLSKEGANRYTPHALPVLNKVLAPAASDRDSYLSTKAIRHADWQDKRIDFQPYPYPSYTEELVVRLQNTVIEADKGFLEALDGKTAATQLVDDRFVKRAIEAAGGMGKFGQAPGYARTELIEV
jgi:NitT/TauT family transport system substrate-binding protein